MKKILLILAAVLSCYLFVVKFSMVESRYECVGTLSSTDGDKPLNLYLKLGTYRWWVGLWSNSDGEAHTEIPNTHIGYFSNLKKVGDQYQIFDFEMNIKGNFSTLSSVLALQIPVKLATDFFDGKCKKID